jgi:hypothetical protein
MYYIFPGDLVNRKIKQSIIDDINNNYIKEINCKFLEVSELPNWQYVTRVECSECINLVELPNWPSVKYVDCGDCESLEILPEWPNIEEVRCDNCPELSDLPYWDTIKKVDCHNCDGLEELPNWVSLIEINCENCKGIYTLPDWPNVEVVRCDVELEDLPKLPNWPKIKKIDHNNILFIYGVLRDQVDYVGQLDYKYKLALSYYTEGSEWICSELNSCLRTNTISSRREVNYMANYLPKIFENCPPLEKELVVYRGVKNLVPLSDGSEFVSGGYISTSVDKSIAEMFGSVIYTINVQPGSRVIPLINSRYFQSEFEILLDKDAVIKCSVHKNSKYYNESECTYYPLENGTYSYGKRKSRKKSRKKKSRKKNMKNMKSRKNS